ncbi:MAG: hypothetical protein MRERV_15c040 [Mycoplasmataceae bacterium RV_VA103A]|nr:MAG: hypothetical protein MRERV_15c040 [Mycoplasmataceae bacterium RV_VA103A]
MTKLEKVGDNRCGKTSSSGKPCRIRPKIWKKTKIPTSEELARFKRTIRE